MPTDVRDRVTPTSNNGEETPPIETCDDSAGGLLRELAQMLFERGVLDKANYRFINFPRDR